MLFNTKKEIVSIFIAPAAGPSPPPAGGYFNYNSMIKLQSAELVAGMGIVGDRWFGIDKFKLNNGKLKNFPHNRNVSLFAVEDFQKVKNKFPNIEIINLRRNIIVKGVQLEKINKIKINNVVLKLSGFCRACNHIEQVNNTQGLAEVLTSCGGARMEVLLDGLIKIGDKIELL